MINENELIELAKLSKLTVSNSEFISLYNEMNEIVNFINLSHCDVKELQVSVCNSVSLRDDEYIEKKNAISGLHLLDNGYFSICNEGTDK